MRSEAKRALTSLEPRINCTHPAAEVASEAALTPPRFLLLTLLYCICMPARDDDGCTVRTVYGTSYHSPTFSTVASNLERTPFACRTFESMRPDY